MTPIDTAMFFIAIMVGLVALLATGLLLALAWSESRRARPPGDEHETAFNAIERAALAPRAGLPVLRNCLLACAAFWLLVLLVAF